MKKKAIIFALTASFGLLGLGIANTLSYHDNNGFLRGRAEDNVSILLDNSNTPEALTSAYNNAVATPSRYTALTYHQAKILDGYHCVLDAEGYIYNSGNAINGISRIVVNIEGSSTLKVGLDEEIDDFTFELTNGENVINVNANYFKLVANVETKVVSLSVTYPVDCESNPALPTGNPGSNLSFVRTDDDHIKLDFVEDVDKTYQFRIPGVVAKTSVHDEQIIDFPLQDGSFNVQIRTIDNVAHTVSSWDSVNTVIADKRVNPLSLNDTVDYFGWVVDDVPYKEGKIIYYTNNAKTAVDSTFVGTFENGFQRKEGTLTFANGMRYIGKFANDQYNDTNGSFDWATRDSDGNVINYGWFYEGGFTNGTPAGQYGNLYLTDYFTHGATGVWKLEHVLMDGFPSIAANQTSTNGIWVSYLDKADLDNNNVYYGPINVAENKSYNTTGLSGKFVVGCRENKETTTNHPSGWYYWDGPMNNAAWPLDNSVGVIKWGYGSSLFIGKAEWHGENNTTMDTRMNYPSYAVFNYFFNGDNTWQAGGLAGQGIASSAKCITYYGQFDGAWCKGYGVWIFDDGTYVKGKFSGTTFEGTWDSENYGTYHPFDVNVDLPAEYSSYICKN